MREQHYVLLFADITGSTQLYEALGDEAAKSVVTGLQAALCVTVTDCGGVVQEIIGDEIMARFDEPNAAARCASEIHERAESYADVNPLPNDIAVSMRLGLHYGPAIVEGERMFGDTVNIAARVAAIAQAGQTITTQALVDELTQDWQQIARRYDVTKVKGKKDPLIIYDLPWRGQDLTAINVVPTESLGRALILTFGTQSMRLGMNDGAFSIGRAITNDLVIDAGPVSRRHAVIEVVRSHFVVTDRSTNGTHVYMNNGENIYLRREQLPIWGEGELAFGAPLQVGSAHVVQYASSDE